MIVFKTFLKILERNKFIVILYTGLLVMFGGLFIENDNIPTDFESVKPDIAIVNHDESGTISTGLVEFLSTHCNIIEIEDDAEKRSDALFYRNINSAIEIPADFSVNFMQGKNLEIFIQNTGDYNSSLAEMLLEKYLNTAEVFQRIGNEELEVIANTKHALEENVTAENISGTDVNDLSKANRYFSFATYPIMACCIYVICLVMNSFKREAVNKRMLVSSISYQKLNRMLLLANCTYSLCIWLIYVLISFILVGNAMWSTSGMIYIFNALVFTINATALAFMISNLVNNREAISGIVNVVALGSSFLCGAFVPITWLPEFVLGVAHILPAYWYNLSNTLLAKAGDINYPEISVNLAIILGFTVVFIIISNFISRRKQVVG